MEVKKLAMKIFGVELKQSITQCGGSEVRIILAASSLQPPDPDWEAVCTLEGE